MATFSRPVREAADNEESTTDIVLQVNQFCKSIGGISAAIIHLGDSDAQAISIAIEYEEFASGHFSSVDQDDRWRSKFLVQGDHGAGAKLGNLR